MVTLIEQWLAVGQQVGLYRVVLPFLLTFIVVYGVLERVALFGSGRQRLHALTAGIIALFVAAFTPAGPSIGAFFSNVFGAIAVVMVGILLAMVVAGLVVGERFTGSALAQALAGLGVATLVLIFLAWGGLDIILPGTGFGSPAIPFDQLAGTAVVVGALVLLFWVFGDGSAEDAQEA